jgi:hypothetical protein
MIAKKSNQQTICYAFLRHRPQNWIVRNRALFYIRGIIFCSSFNLASISVDMVIKLAQVV